MAQRKETKLWSLIRQGTKNYPVHWTRIENLVDSGTPDTWGVYKGQYFPVELKMEESGWIYLRPAQVVWMRKHLEAGGVCWIIYRTDNDEIVLVLVTKLFLDALEVKGKYLAFRVFSITHMPYYLLTKPYRYEDMLNTLALIRRQIHVK